MTSSPHPLATYLPATANVARQLEREVRFVTEPIVDLRSGAVVAREVLARPRNGMYFPSWVVGTSSVLAEAVWWCALECAAPFLAAGQATHVNVGPRQLAQPEFVRALADVLEPHQFGHLVVEVTEHEPLDPTHHLLANVAWLREQGSTIALDDFGEGFANFASLAVLLPEIVKVSRDVVQSGEGHASAEWFLSTCRSLGVRRTVVERIESVAQRTWAVRAGFDAGQGFLWT